jgi:hypothetical protein
MKIAVGYMASLLLIAVAGASVAAQESYVDLPFAGVSLLKPEGFEAAKRFDGIENKSASIAIMAAQYPGAFPDNSKPFQANATLANGVKIESRTDQTIAGLSGCLVKASQDTATARFKKWILLFGDGATTQMVTANLALSADDTQMDSVKGLLLAVKPYSGEKPAIFADMPYEVTSKTLKPTRRSQKSIVFTIDEVVPLKDQNNPLLFVGMSFVPNTVQDPKSLLESRIKQEPGGDKLTITTNAEITVDGLKGQEIVTQGKDAQQNVRYGYWAVLIDGDDYYLFQGATGVKEAQSHIDQYAAIVRSFVRKTPAK